jgi:hypothetical protein
VSRRHHGTDLAQQGDTGSHRAAGRQQVVDDHHALSRLDRVRLDFDAVVSVFQPVFEADRLARQLAALAQHDEAATKLERERRRHQETARFKTRQQVGLIGPHRLRHPPHRHLPGIGVPQQRRNVVK